MRKCPPIVFLEGANINHYAFVEGAIILPCQMLGGQMSTHAIFHRGADVRGGKCPAPIFHRGAHVRGGGGKCPTLAIKYYIYIDCILTCFIAYWISNKILFCSVHLHISGPGSGITMPPKS